MSLNFGDNSEQNVKDVNFAFVKKTVHCYTHVIDKKNLFNVVSYEFIEEFLLLFSLKGNT